MGTPDSHAISKQQGNCEYTIVSNIHFYGSHAILTFLYHAIVDK
jgi:hypothetical protein